MLFCEHQGESRVERVCLFTTCKPCEYGISAHVIVSCEEGSSSTSLHLTLPHNSQQARTHTVVVLSTLWAGQSSAGRECSEGQRETERQGGKKSIGIDVQHCIKTVTAQRKGERAGGMERLLYTS